MATAASDLQKPAPCLAGIESRLTLLAGHPDRFCFSSSAIDREIVDELRGLPGAEVLYRRARGENLAISMSFPLNQLRRVVRITQSVRGEIVP